MVQVALKQHSKSISRPFLSLSQGVFVSGSAMSGTIGINDFTPVQMPFPFSLPQLHRPYVAHPYAISQIVP